MSMSEAAAWQERFVTAVTHEFRGDPGLFGAGDVGMEPALGRPAGTAAAERALAHVFGAEDCALVQGAGTGAVRLALFTTIPPGSRLLVHAAPTYLTSRLTLEAMGIELVTCDFNDDAGVEATLRDDTPDGVLVQHMRPRPEDRYDVGSLCTLIRRSLDIATPIVCDDNYAPLKVRHLGVALGADISAFSVFKLGGPEGIGCVLGSRLHIDRLRRFMLSGGGVVQGPEAVAVVQALARAALPMAHQAQVTLQVAARLQAGEVPDVVRAYATNAPETTILVELAVPRAAAVRRAAADLGAAVRPVGMESFYEVVPAFLKPSKTMMEQAPGIEEHVLRISAMRAGADLVIGILAAALSRAAVVP